jgi:glycosyltransferase involved in cell wall biosynthesis
MLILGLVKSEDHVCCRYRLSAFRDHLAQEGHQLEVCPWPQSWLGRLFIHKKLRHADVVVVQRRLLAPWELLLVRRAAKRLVFDFDDAVFLRDSYAPNGLASTGRKTAFARMVRAADLVMAGNSFLGANAEAVITTARVRIEPTRVDSSLYPLARHERTDAGVKLVWIGSSSTLQGLERSVELWEEIGRNCPGVSLKLLCDKGLVLRHLRVEFSEWSKESEAKQLADADIGVSWLPPDDWSRGKCGLKVLQYMAAGLPVVANPVGVQTQMVRHGETGYLAETPAEWCEAVARLSADPALRRRMGRAGRQVVEEHYSIEAGAALWTDQLRQLTEAPHLTEVGV